jgi:hypothetical protein
MTAPALAPAIVVVPQHSHSAARSFFVNVGNAIQSGAQAVGRAFGRAWAWISNAFTSHVLPFIRTTATFVKDFFRDVFVRFKVDPGFRRALIIGSLGTAAVIALVALTALGIKALVNRKKEEKPAAPAAAAGTPPAPAGPAAPAAAAGTPPAPAGPAAPAAAADAPVAPPAGVTAPAGTSPAAVADAAAAAAAVPPLKA